MSYNILPNIIFLFAVLGIILIILRHLPDAGSGGDGQKTAEPYEALRIKGLPAEAASKAVVIIKLWAKRIWVYVLEAKDFRPAAATGYKIKKIIRGRFSSQKPAADQEIPKEVIKNADKETEKDERFFLERIRQEPKNLQNYDELGKYYLDLKNFTDAKDIYLYLSNHQSGNADYHAKLGHCFYKMQNFDQAAESYKKSVALDSTQPNRYYNLGLSLESAGDGMQALEFYGKAINMEPANIKYYLGLGNCQQKLGSIDEAKATLNAALERDPGNEQVKLRLAQLF